MKRAWILARLQQMQQLYLTMKTTMKKGADRLRRVSFCRDRIRENEDRSLFPLGLVCAFEHARTCQASGWECSERYGHVFRCPSWLHAASRSPRSPNRFFSIWPSVWSLCLCICSLRIQARTQYFRRWIRF